MHEAYVLLGSSRFPMGSTVVQTHSDFPLEDHRPVVTEEIPGQRLTLDLGGQHVTAELVPQSYPEAEQYAETSASSFAANWRVPFHGAHLYVTGDGAPETWSGELGVQGLRDFTGAVAAIAKAAGALAIYFPAAGATHEPGFFYDVVKSEETPVFLWTGVSSASDGDDRAGFLSTAMDQFGMMDLLLTCPDDEADEAVNFFGDLLRMAIDQGKVLPDGETVGRDEDEAFEVWYEASPVDGTKTVWRVAIDDDD